MAGKPTTLHTIINELVDRTNTDTQRIRALESWEKALNLRIESIERELLSINGNLQKLASGLETSLKKRDQGITELRNIVREVVKQLRRTVSTERVKELEAMIDIYSPIKSNFITREEAENMIGRSKSGRPKNNK
jgi:predicted  nucleic acid-binding Zn-ribbon protein